MSPQKTEDLGSAAAQGAVEGAILGGIAAERDARIADLLRVLGMEDANLKDAIAQLGKCRIEVAELIARNRGGFKGLHGFITEIAEVGVANARSAIVGKAKLNAWVNDNGPADIVRDGIEIQQKFYAGGVPRTLDAFLKHLEKYPDFVADGGRYQLPKDTYEELLKLRSMSKHEATTMLSSSQGGPSYSDWKRVQAFFKDGSIPVDRIEPSVHEYADVQPGKIDETLNGEEASLRQTHADRVRAEEKKHAPTLKGAAQAVATSALLEGGMTFAFAIIRKVRAGTPLTEFTNEDWKEILQESGIATAKGGIRGGALYAVANLVPRAKTSAPFTAAANAFITAGFTIAQNAYAYRTGSMDAEEFGESCLLAAIDSSIALTATLVGQAVIPIPILGSIIGSSVGAILTRIAHEYLDTTEQAMVDKTVSELMTSRSALDAQQAALLAELDAQLRDYTALLEAASTLDPLEALSASAVLARECGVASQLVLETPEDVAAFFCD